MTRISSYRLYQCSSCGQKHILPNYGTINLAFNPPPANPKPEDLRVCQRCSQRKPLKSFIPLGILHPPARDTTPKWFKKIRKLLDKNYKESEPHPMKLYPDLDKNPFDPENYFPEWMRKNMVDDDYPLWYREFIKNR